jgi:hypothetical protein
MVAHHCLQRLAGPPQPHHVLALQQRQQVISPYSRREGDREERWRLRLDIGRRGIGPVLGSHWCRLSDKDEQPKVSHTDSL